MNNPTYENLIINVPNFPKEGVTFKDISPLLQYKLNDVISDLGSEINWDEIDVVLGIESRGFILGSALAIKFSKGFLPIRKKGKLPPPVVGEDYELEYGTDRLEMSINDKPLKAVLVDDVLATGGTLKACLKMCERNNFNIITSAVLIDLQFLNNMEKENYSIKSVLKYK